MGFLEIDMGLQNITLPSYLNKIDINNDVLKKIF